MPISVLCTPKCQLSRSGEDLSSVPSSLDLVVLKIFPLNPLGAKYFSLDAAL